MLKIAVLASTRGTDLQAIIDEIQAGKLKNVEISCVISNKKDAYALTRAEENNIKTYFVDPKGKIREEFDEEIAEILKHEKVDLICLIGYMRILSKEFVAKFPNKIINVHPALIPSFCGPKYYGANVHEEVIKRGVKVSGCTFHFVNEECDGGPIILQETVRVDIDDTTDTLKDKVQALEKKWYPKLIELIKKNKVKILSDNRVQILK